jgi:hypothetical protein
LWPFDAYFVDMNSNDLPSNVLSVVTALRMISPLNEVRAVGVSNSFTMNRFTLILFLFLAALTGCARQYVIKKSNGVKIVTASKPKLKNGFYTFKDAAGNQNRVSQNQVLLIEPASMAEEEKTRFTPPKPK